MSLQGSGNRWDARIYLVVQWVRICMPKQGTQVWSLAWEDSTCRGATNPTCHNYWACALEPACCSYWSYAPRARTLQHWETCTATKSSPCSPRLEESSCKATQPKINNKIKKKCDANFTSQKQLQADRNWNMKVTKKAFSKKKKKRRRKAFSR